MEQIDDFNFDINNLKRIVELIILSINTENNNIRQKYFFELLELGKIFSKIKRK